MEIKNEIEIWKDIEGYEGLYQVSSWGRVKSLPRTIIRNNGIKQTFPERILKLSKDKYGYSQLTLCDVGKMKKVKAHRLVALAFLENPENLPMINHKNEIKTDNRVENLEFCSAHYNNTYNNIHIKRGEKLKGKNYLSKEGRQKQCKAISIPIIQYTKDMVFVREWDSAKSASIELNIKSTNICMCCKGKIKTAKGFIWRYKENNLNRKTILQYTKDMTFIKEWGSATDVRKELNINNSYILSVCNGKRKSAGGYIWRYKE